jgi:predicted MPP superfamily phosphohydrolase
MSYATLFALSIALHLYIGARLVPALPGMLAMAALALVLVVSALSTPLGLIARRIARAPVADTLAWVGMVCMGLFSSLLVLTLARDVLLLLPALQPWRAASAESVAIAALLLTAVGLLNARRTAQVVTVRIPMDLLPAGLRDFGLVQSSDIHVGPTIKQRYLEAIVESVNRLKPDVVAITGDLVDGSVQELGPHVAPLAKLKARYGSFFVTGNHEYYSGAQPWINELRRLGIRVLMNEHVVIEHGGAHLVLAGVPDYGAGHYDTSHTSDPQRAMQGAPAHAVKVLLAHQPRSAPAAAAAGFDLQLSGHTHGGQFLPWNLLVPLQQPYTAGLHRLRQLWVYVSRGTGYWGPPKRVGAPSEITEVLLQGK